MISVILSVRDNLDGLLEKTLKSIEQQTYTDWELVAVDDGSTDDTSDILNKFLNLHRDRVDFIVNEKNIGLTKSLVRATSRARGQYLARIDSGDEFFPDKLQKQVEFLERYSDYGIVGCNYINRYLPNNSVRKNIMPDSDVAIRKTILKRNPFAHSCVMMRQDVYRESGGYNSEIVFGQDYDLWFRVLKITKAANLREFLCHRTIHAQSISYVKQRAQMRQCVKTQWKYMNRWNPVNYFYLIEPTAIFLVPTKIRIFVRRLSGRLRRGQ